MSKDIISNQLGIQAKGKWTKSTIKKYGAF